MSKRSIAKAGEVSAKAGNLSVRLRPRAPEYDRVSRRSSLVGQAPGLAHVTFSHVMVRVLIVPVSGSTDGVVDR